MGRSVKDMVSYDIAIKRVRENMRAPETVEEAQSIMRACGILDKNNELVEAYRDIFVKIEPRKKRNERK